MQITGSPIPFQAARAYGIQPARPVAPTSAADATSAVDRASAVDRTGSVGRVQRPTATPDLRRIDNPILRKLVAGQVAQPIDFSGAATPMPKDELTLPLYTRAADKIEAAVAVNRGRRIDVRG
ncbi:MAG: hypothetical protein KDA25_00470 [Phycisphaerales bacterium]|nr:hypothetical protein [Phycisphaerales bacterium]